LGTADLKTHRTPFKNMESIRPRPARGEGAGDTGMDAAAPRGEALAAVLEAVRGRVTRQQFQTWFRSGIRILEATPEQVTIGAVNGFVRDWLEDYYADVLREAVRDTLGLHGELVFAVAPADPAEPPSAALPAATASVAIRAARHDASRADAARESGRGGALAPDARFPNFWSDVPLNDAYTFENFVVGPTNGLAHAAAQAVAEKPALAYNPLFMHGSVGLGKTHILQATCRSLLERRPDLRVVFLSCETFANQFIRAVQSGDLNNFRNRYRDSDVLVIDDIHFLANKERTQEEFFHTFNQLYHSKRQIILSSDSHPRDIPSIEERLVSRFKWGLVTEIEPPGFETRLHIVRMKAAARGVQFPVEVASFLAEQITSNIREIEGAIAKVASLAELARRPVDIAMAREALRDTLAPSRRQVTIDAIVRCVTSHFGVKPVDLQSKRRSRSIAHPRQVCMFLARQLTPHSLVEIGGYFGGRDHTTVMYAVDRVQQELATDPALKGLIEDLARELKGS
jgi:chromosomal replication initiator protein